MKVVLGSWFCCVEELSKVWGLNCLREDPGKSLPGSRADTQLITFNAFGLSLGIFPTIFVASSLPSVTPWPGLPQITLLAPHLGSLPPPSWFYSANPTNQLHLPPLLRTLIPRLTLGVAWLPFSTFHTRCYCRQSAISQPLAAAFCLESLQLQQQPTEPTLGQQR